MWQLQARLGQQEEYVLELEARLGGLETNEEVLGEVSFPFSIFSL